MLRYSYVPSSVFLALRGDGCSRLVLDVLIFRRNTSTHRSPFMTIAVIADWAGVSVSQTYRCIDKLVDLGLVEHVAERRGEHMYYVGCVDQKQDAAVSEEDAQRELAQLVKQFEEI